MKLFLSRSFHPTTVVTCGAVLLLSLTNSTENVDQADTKFGMSGASPSSNTVVLSKKSAKTLVDERRGLQRRMRQVVSSIQKRISQLRSDEDPEQSNSNSSQPHYGDYHARIQSDPQLRQLRALESELRGEFLRNSQAIAIRKGR